MLDSQQLDILCRKLGVTEPGRKLIDSIREGLPVRRVGGGRSNICVRFPSQKMGVTIQAESHTVELPFIYELEHDSDVIEFYDQPTHLVLRYPGKSGRNLGVTHTPDFLVIGENWIGFVECKPEEELAHLSKNSPHRYRKDEDGNWICPPGELSAKEYSLSYRVWSSAGINWIFQDNIRFLEDYLRIDCPEPSKRDVETIRSWFDEKTATTLEELLKGKHGVGNDAIYRMIAMDQIHVDLRKDRLSEPMRTVVALDAATAIAYTQLLAGSVETWKSEWIGVMAAPGESVSWDGIPWKVLNVGVESVTLESDGRIAPLPVPSFERLIASGKIVAEHSKQDPLKSGRDILDGAGKKALEIANARSEILRTISEENEEISEARIPSKRTMERWTSRQRAAEREFGAGYFGLIPQTTKRGNRTSRIGETVKQLMNETISGIYESNKQVRLRTAYGQLCLLCERQHVASPSYESFRKAVRRRPKEEQVKKRQGKRAAYAHEIFHWNLDKTIPRHGSRPLEVAHIDHTELDIELVGSDDGIVLGRPWLTIMVDANSRMILAFYLSFDPPSYRSCMMVVRDCVRRWQRLPSVFVLDNGKEFDSVYFESLLAKCECVKKSRPPAQSRFGSVCERLFGTTNTEFIHNLTGNTQITRKVRIMTKSFNPKRLAVWNLPDLQSLMETFFFDIYNTSQHPAFNETPKKVFDEGLARTGLRSHRIIPYSDDFRIMTMPSTPKGTATVNPNTGIQINNIRYWHDGFRNPEVAGKPVEVRLDPENCGVVYAFVSGRWVQCFSQYHETLSGRSRREIAMASREMRARDRTFSEKKKLSARELALFLEGANQQEDVLSQRKKDLEARRVGDSSGALSFVANPSQSPVVIGRERNGEGSVAPKPTHTKRIVRKMEDF